MGRPLKKFERAIELWNGCSKKLERATELLVLENDTHNIVAKTFINHENLCKLIQTL